MRCISFLLRSACLCRNGGLPSSARLVEKRWSPEPCGWGALTAAARESPGWFWFFLPVCSNSIGSECVSHTSRYASSEEEMHDWSSRPRSSEEEELGGLGRKIKANEAKRAKKKKKNGARPPAPYTFCTNCCFWATARRLQPCGDKKKQTKK